MSPQENEGDAIKILLNDQLVDTVPEFDNFVDPHEKCFNSFDIENDVIKLQSGGIDAVSISVDLIYGDETTSLLFGRNQNTKTLSLDANYPSCHDDSEKAMFIKIKNGTIYESECESKFVFRELNFKKSFYENQFYDSVFF